MKKYFFFPVFTLFLSLMLLVGCDRSDQPEPVDVAGPNTTEVTVGQGDPDGGLDFRACPDLAHCDITVTVTAGTSNFTICGQTDVTVDTCDIVTACDRAKGYRETYSGSANFCVHKVDHPGFTITNNGTGNITVTITVVGGMGLANIVITGGNTAEFEVDANCNVDGC